MHITKSMNMRAQKLKSILDEYFFNCFEISIHDIDEESEDENDHFFTFTAALINGKRNKHLFYGNGIEMIEIDFENNSFEACIHKDSVDKLLKAPHMRMNESLKKLYSEIICVDRKN